MIDLISLPKSYIIRIWSIWIFKLSSTKIIAKGNLISFRNQSSTNQSRNNFSLLSVIIMSLAKALAVRIDLENNISEAENIINYVNGDAVDVTMGSDGNLTNRGLWTRTNQMSNQLHGIIPEHSSKMLSTAEQQFQKMGLWRKTGNNKEACWTFQFPDTATGRDHC